MELENRVGVPDCLLTANQLRLVGGVLRAFSVHNGGGEEAVTTEQAALELAEATVEALQKLSTHPGPQVEVRGVVFERTPPPPQV